MNLKDAAAAQRADQEKAAREAAEAERMAEFHAKERELIGDLPEPFFQFVSALAWDLGHAYGFSEVLNYADDIGENLRRAIREHSSPRK
jgi:hypothetical protein